MNIRRQKTTDSSINFYDATTLGPGSQSFVVDLTPANSKVLEIGAGSGIISMVLEKTKGASVTAVDLHPSQMLTSRISRVLQCNLNNNDWPDIFEKGEKFNVIIAADVLEHLYDPLKTLLKIKDLLDENGCIILSLPNASHAGVIASLLNNNFEYHKEGLLDRTHIRFFGLENIQEIHDAAGLQITEAKFVLKRPEDTELNYQWKSLSYAQKQAISAHSKGLVYQTIIKSVPAKENTAHIVDLLQMPIDIKYHNYLSPIQAKVLITYSEFLCSLSKIIRTVAPSNEAVIRLADSLHQKGADIHFYTQQWQ